MSFKLKTLIGVYIFSILLFSGVSRAAAPESVHGFAVAEGKVFELNGYLYFEADNSEALLVHSSNFKFFKGIELPIDVQAHSVISQQESGFSGTLRTIRFITNTIQQGAVL